MDTVPRKLDTFEVTWRYPFLLLEKIEINYKITQIYICECVRFIDINKWLTLPTHLLYKRKKECKIFPDPLQMYCSCRSLHCS